MRAAILAVGSELLGADRLDTNSLRLTESLLLHGVALGHKSVVGDDPEEIAAAVELALGRCQLVLITGGLGPTRDDVTREGVARALGRSLERREEIVEDIRRKFARFGKKMPEANRRQADLIEGAEVLENRWGTAPGQRVVHGEATIFLLPGVPAELERLVPLHLEPWLARRAAPAAETAVLKVACIGESALEDRLRPYYDELGGDRLSILSRPGEITLRVGAGDGGATLERRLGRLVEVLGDSVFARDAETSLEGVVGQGLRAAGATVVTAESCTGGLVAERLTRVPGSSDYFLGGVVTYADRQKRELLGVPAELLAAHGAVSEAVVRAMARGARERLGGDFAIAVSGIAGPGGGSDEKPVGTVHVAIAGPGGRELHRRLQLPGGRRRIRAQAAQWALDLLRRELADRAAEAAGSEAPAVAG